MPTDLQYASAARQAGRVTDQMDGDPCLDMHLCRVICMSIILLKNTIRLFFISQIGFLGAQGVLRRSLLQNIKDGSR
jgi:hypothetical protein